MSNPVMSNADVLDVYVLETRAKLLEIAATLGRGDSSEAADGISRNRRIKLIRDALKALGSSVLKGWR